MGFPPRELPGVGGLEGTVHGPEHLQGLVAFAQVEPVEPDKFVVGMSILLTGFAAMQCLLVHCHHVAVMLTPADLTLGFSQALVEHALAPLKAAHLLLHLSVERFSERTLRLPILVQFRQLTDGGEHGVDASHRLAPEVLGTVRVSRPPGFRRA